MKKLKTSLSIYFWKSNGGNAKEREMSQTARVEVVNIAADCKIKLAKGNQKQFKIKLIWLKNNKKKGCFIPAFLQEDNLKIAENFKELFNIDSMQKEILCWLFVIDSCEDVILEICEQIDISIMGMKKN